MHSTWTLFWESTANHATWTALISQHISISSHKSCRFLWAVAERVDLLRPREDPFIARSELVCRCLFLLPLLSPLEKNTALKVFVIIPSSVLCWLQESKMVGDVADTSCCHGAKGPGYATPLLAMAGPRESLLYVTCVYSGNDPFFLSLNWVSLDDDSKVVLWFLDESGCGFCPENPTNLFGMDPLFLCGIPFAVGPIRSTVWIARILGYLDMYGGKK